MIQEGTAPPEKKVYQINFKFLKDFAPNRHLNPYQLLEEANKEIRKTLDLEFVQVKYNLVSTKNQKELGDRLFSEKGFKVDHSVNNIFSLPESNGTFMRDFILNDVFVLEPPTGEKLNFEADLEKEREDEEEKKLTEVEMSVKEIMNVYNMTATQERERSTVRSNETFKTLPMKDMNHNEYYISARAVMNQNILDRLNEQKNSNKPMELKTKTVTIKIYMHPTNVWTPIYKMTNECPITNWGQSAVCDDSCVDYFSMADLHKKVNKINSSVKIISYINFRKKKSGLVHAISLTSYLWNEIVLKMTINLSQVKQIQRAKEGKVTEYYLHLSYPAQYYVTKLSPDEANSINFQLNWTRTENFILLNNRYIQENYFLRYYLFNNTVVRITLLDDLVEGYSVQEADTELARLYEKFRGTIEVNTLPGLMKPTASFKLLSQQIEYKKFLTKINHPNKQLMDKVWMIKYLLLVMVRHNYLLPTSMELDVILNKVEEDLEHIDCYLYTLWRVATNMWGYNNEKKRFYQYMLDESETAKKMKAEDIMKRIWYSSETITYIFRASLTPSGYIFNAPTPQMKGRLLKHYSRESEFFMRISLGDESENDLKNQKYISKRVFRGLMNNITVLNRSYIPLGWSPSQLRSFSLWYFHEIEDRPSVKRLKRDYILSFLGSFEKIKNPAKRAARIGQSFSASWTYNAKSITYKVIPDEVSETGHLYTDGIGKISEDVVERISLKLNIRELSLIQMRYLGAKGVLVVDRSLPKNTVHLRPSMIKYECPEEQTKNYLDILDWNKYKAGYLNRQVIILLRTLGISNSVFMGLQEEHIKRISNLTFKDCSIFKHMDDDLNNEITNLEAANKTILTLLKTGFKLEDEPFFHGVLETLKKNGYHHLKIKSSIQVEKSARIIGIIDEYGVLDEDEIYCAVYDQFSLNPQREVIEGTVIITRNPCLDPADIRKVCCISKKEVEMRLQNRGLKPDTYDKFINCVVFPMKGKFPLTSQISGSDLDGDNFFVCWDPRLIPAEVSAPNLIDEPIKAAGEPENQCFDYDYEQMLNFFIDYTNYEKLGQIANSHLVHADMDTVNFANNKNCLKLAQIHGKAVDFPKSGFCPPVPYELLVSNYPDFMEKDEDVTYPSISILGHLYRDIKEKINRLLEDKEYVAPTLDNDLIRSFKFDHTDSEIRDCFKALREYEREISTLIHLVEVDSEFEIYSGNFSIVKDKVKAFGKNRLIATIMNIRKTFFEAFFENYQEDARKYEEADEENGSHTKTPYFFSPEVLRKAQIYYLVSYIYRFSHMQLTDPKLLALRDQIYDVIGSLNQFKKQGEFCGFVWFVLPKLIINLKLTDQLLKQMPSKEQTEPAENKNKPESDDQQYI